jgi:ferredoxin like protein
VSLGTTVSGRLSTAERLGADAFDTDSTSHLKLSDPELCKHCALKPCIAVCPAEVYRWEGEHLRISYENCLETGACRVACQQMGNHALVWAFPAAGRGVHYRFG